jgi:hypothetical protein
MMTRDWMRRGLTALACVMFGTGAAFAQQLQFPDLSKLSAEAKEVVDVSVDEALLSLAAGFMSGTGDDAAAKALIGGLKGIYVKSLEFERPGAYDPALLDGLRRQLSTGGWTRLVTTRSAADNSDVGVYLFRQGEQTGGLAVLVSSPRDLTIVNIVGAIDLEQLRQLQGKFGVPGDLGMER